MQTINKDAKSYNGTTIFVEAVLLLDHVDLAAAVQRSGRAVSFDIHIQSMIADHLAHDLNIFHSHLPVACRVWHEPHTELRTWNAEAIFVRNMQEVAFA